MVELGRLAFVLFHEFLLTPLFKSLRLRRHSLLHGSHVFLIRQRCVFVIAFDSNMTFGAKLLDRLRQSQANLTDAFNRRSFSIINMAHEILPHFVIVFLPTLQKALNVRDLTFHVFSLFIHALLALFDSLINFLGLLASFRFYVFENLL